MSFRREDLAEGVTLAQAKALTRTQRWRLRRKGVAVPFVPQRAGFTQSPEHTEKRKRFGPAHHCWKGEETSPKNGRKRALRRFPVLPACEGCGSPKSERHHIDENPSNNAQSNISFFCRRCHMREHSRLMAMSTSAMAEGISENTVESWLNISGDLLSAASRFTIETASKLTIALRIWNSSLLPNIIGGTGGLSPNWEPICLARKPLSEGTVAANVLRWGTGAINVDGCRIATDETITATRNYLAGAIEPGGMEKPGDRVFTRYEQNKNGRFPANLIHDGSPEVLAGFPEGSSSRSEVTSKPGQVYGGGAGLPSHTGIYGFDDKGSAARFFYTAKADADDRLGSKHPTVKPVDLMQWLVRLICPKGGTVLDPFAGTGTTGAAAFIEGCRAVLIEREAEYQADIARRMELLLSGPDERSRKLTTPEPVHSLPLFAESAQ